MRFGRRGRFHDLVERQLDLFAADDAELLAEVAEAEGAWNAAGADEAEEAYGDYQLVVDAIADRLLDIRESYAGTLDEAAAAEYTTDSPARPPVGIAATPRCSRISTSRSVPRERQPASSSDGSPGGRGCRKRASLRCVDASARRPWCSSERPRA